MTILILGAVCIVAALVGGRLKAAGVEFPLLMSMTVRIPLGVVGAVFFAVGMVQEFDIIGREPANPGAQDLPPSSVATTIGPTTGTTSDPPPASSSQSPSKHYLLEAPRHSMVDLDTGKTVHSDGGPVPPGIELRLLQAFFKVKDNSPDELYRLVGDESVDACRSALAQRGNGELPLSSEDIRKGDVFCTGTDQQRIAILEVIRPSRHLDSFGLTFDVRLWEA